VLSKPDSGSTNNFCNVNSSGAANNNNANNAYGFAPDSVRRTMCRFFGPMRPTQKEKASHRRKPVNGRLDTPERTLLAWPLTALGGFMLVGVMRHTTQTVQRTEFTPRRTDAVQGFFIFPI
jgi:hypothetical protein